MDETASGPARADQFSDMGGVYEESEQQPLRRDLEAPSMFRALGDVHGLEVLDAGCGSGFYTRLLAQAGAGRVLGLDGSAGMLAVAREREDREHLGVAYEHGDVADAAQWGPFDVVCAVYVLPYAPSRERLAAMCRGVAGALRPGGRFVTFALNPEVSTDRDWYEPYGFTVEPAAPGTPDGDGMPLALTVTFLQTPMTIHPYRWSRATHEWALREAGFTDVAWTSPEPTARGIDQQGAAYWERYTRRPHALIVQADRH
ncbi:class I SAM-dependent methyltransferase [Streptomyces syringium]|uniref:class I SAM-dependent methyltransferase n=1 Tax=Streptomyces syringium TaxID=76729 RepID=UPI003453F4A3